MTETDIALVEDDADLRDSLFAYLDHSGYSVAAAGSALGFYRLLAQHTFDLVILDVNLPDEDGLSIATFLRKQFSDTGVIMMTARGMAKDRIAGFESGTDIYLVKPVQGEGLVSAISSVQRRIKKSESSALNDQENAHSTAEQTWSLEKDTLRLMALDGQSTPLTSLERVCY